MLIRDIHIVDKHVRMYDMDGSFVEFCASDFVDMMEEWYKAHKERLLYIMAEETKRLQRSEEQVL